MKENEFFLPQDLPVANYSNIDEEKLDETYESIVDVLGSRERIDEANKKWEENYAENPATFWEQKSIEYLGTLSAGERVQLLRRASRFLAFSPSDTFLYCTYFPEDISAIALDFSDSRGPKSGPDFKMCGLLAREFELARPDFFKKDVKWFGQYRDMCDRRELAREHLLYPDEFYIGKDIQETFPEASADYLKVLNEAITLDINGTHILDVSEMFGEHFESLSYEEKSRFLRLCLAQLHNILVQGETFNSRFTKQAAEKQGSITQNSSYYTHGHSMLFKTYQPSVVYDRAQSYFDYLIDNTPSSMGDVEEYPFHRMLINVLNKFKSLTLPEGATDEFSDDGFLIEQTIPSNVQLLVDMWDKNRNPIFANGIAEALTAQDPTYAASLLLEKIKKERQDKSALAAILYRLEFGKIGISKEGVKYLEKMYDLGEYNNPDYFVNRLTSRGEIGIFNEQNRLIKYFYLGTLEDEEDKLAQAAVLDFTYDTLFVPKEGETEEERAQRLEYLEEFKESYFDFYDESFLERTGVRFNNLTFKEQGSLLLFTKAAGDSLKEEVYDFCRAHGEQGIRLFLLVNQKDFMFGQSLLTIAKSLDPNTVQVVFEKISDILGTLEDVSGMVKDNPILEKAVEEKMPVIQWKIIKKALETLEAVILESQADTTGEVINERIIKKLSGINTEAVILASTLTTMRHVEINEDMDLLNSFSETGIYRYEGHEFSNQELKEIKEIYDINYSSTPKLASRLQRGFNKSLKNPHVDFSVVKHKEKVAAVCAFEYLDDRSVYFGKFNVDPAFRGSELGETIMEDTLDDVSRRHIIHADCDIETPVSANYIERGFIGIKGYNLDEINALAITRNESKNHSFDSKVWTEYYISKEARMGESVELDGGKYVIYACALGNIKEAPLSLLDQENEDGSRYVLSRYIRQKKTLDAGVESNAYFVFEKVGKDKLVDYNKVFERPSII